MKRMVTAVVAGTLLAGCVALGEELASAEQELHVEIEPAHKVVLSTSELFLTASPEGERSHHLADALTYKSNVLGTARKITVHAVPTEGLLQGWLVIRVEASNLEGSNGSPTGEVSIYTGGVPASEVDLITDINQAGSNTVDLTYRVNSVPWLAMAGQVAPVTVTYRLMAG